MPVKSNKFDFTNRGSLGLKMGQIIGNALEKEADKILKDALKQSRPNRRQSDTTTSVGAADTYTHITHLDIRAPSKELGDEGCFAMIAGLETALSNSTARVGLALEDLNLTNNHITTAALERLAPVIILAAHTLRSLNLSNNHIKVDSAQEAQQWDNFLQSFANCTRLRRIDFSGNTNLGSKALEIFARLHVASDHIPPVTISNLDDTSKAMTLTNRRPSSDSGIGVQSFEKTPLADETLRSGLRSIAFIALNNVGLDDHGALWLSYIIEDHFYPIQLIDDFESARSDSASSACPQDGIDWTGNDATLSKDGLLVLRKSSLLREQLLKDGDAYDNDLLDAADERDDSAALSSSYRRKSNGNDSATDEELEGRLLRSGRRKLQRAIVISSGVRSVELWQAALRIVTLSRMFLASVGVPRGQEDHGYRRPCENMPPKSDNSAPLRAKKTRYLPLDAAEVVFKRIEETLHREETPHRGTRAPPQTPNGRDGEPHSPRNASIAEHLSHLEIQDSNAFVTYQKSRLQAAQTGAATDMYRDEAHASHLPSALIKYLIRSALSPRERAALNTEQFDRAYQWGSDRASLQKELEWLKDHKSIRVMRLLETIDCIEYSRI